MEKKDNSFVLKKDKIPTNTSDKKEEIFDIEDLLKEKNKTIILDINEIEIEEEKTQDYLKIKNKTNNNVLDIKEILAHGDEPTSAIEDDDIVDTIDELNLEEESDISNLLNDSVNKDKVIKNNFINDIDKKLSDKFQNTPSYYKIPQSLLEKNNIDDENQTLDFYISKLHEISKKNDLSSFDDLLKNLLIKFKNEKILLIMEYLIKKI